MDQLEKYIQSNANQWDDKKAPPLVWNRITKELDRSPQTRSTSNRRYWYFLPLLIISSAILYFGLIKNNHSRNTASSDLPMLYAEVESFNETERYYLSAIYASQKKLQEQHSDLTLDQDLKELDEIDLQLREDYKNAQGIYREHILRALIHNHQTKLDLLENVLFQISEPIKNQDNVI